MAIGDRQLLLPPVGRRIVPSEIRTAIRSIAQLEIERTVRSDARRGYVLDFGPDVLDVIVDDGAVALVLEDGLVLINPGRHARNSFGPAHLGGEVHGVEADRGPGCIAGERLEIVMPAELTR